MSRRQWGFTVLLSLAIPATAQERSVSLAAIDSCVARAMRVFNVPGVSLAVVKDDSIIVCKGYGVRTLGKPTPVDARTRFGIASNTKAFTSTALGLLVEEGKLRWDGRVIDYLPWFQLSDPYVTHELTVRDLLVHHSGLGLGAGDLLWWPPSLYNRRQIAERLRYIPLATSFRSAYAYDNVLYLVAGELILAVTGQTWEDFITRRILQPVGMSTTTVTHSSASGSDNVATPHGVVDGRLRILQPFTSDNTNPAGGINSNAEDMARWMEVQLDSGRTASGSRLFSPKTTVQLWTIVTPLDSPEPPPGLKPLQSNFNGYALGFGVRDYRGMKVVSHTGGLPGYLSRVTLVPQIKLGVSVLTNQESGGAFNAISQCIVDMFLQAPSYDWVSAFKSVEEHRDSVVAAGALRQESLRTAHTQPPLPLSRYAGTYTDAWYGDIQLTEDHGKLVLRFSQTPSLVGDLEYWQFNTFEVRWRDRELRADAFVTFSLDADGTVLQATMKPVSSATDFSFDFQDLHLRPASQAK